VSEAVPGSTPCIALCTSALEMSIILVGSLLLSLGGQRHVNENYAFFGFLKKLKKSKNQKIR
jgi:predicted GNAT family N-acyltransferase